LCGINWCDRNAENTFCTVWPSLSLKYTENTVSLKWESVSANFADTPTQYFGEAVLTILLVYFSIYYNKYTTNYLQQFV